LILTRAAFADLDGWRADPVSAALPAFLKSCARLGRLADAAPVGPRGLAGRAADWRGPCAEAASIPPGGDAAVRAFFEARFLPYRATAAGGAAGLFTGYYEPELRGSRTRRGPYTVPLYRRPPDLVTVDLGLFRPEWEAERLVGRVVDGTLRPYLRRAEVDAGALAGQGLELLWVDDPVDAFMLQVQGSGRVVLAGGGVVRVGFAAHNGHAYRSIGRVLVERGALEPHAASLESIRAWIAAHPDQASPLLRENARYVFFREVVGEGPIGAQGAVLTAGRSLAVDPRFVPLGVPVWVDAADPDGRVQPVRRLMVAQDTGGAITGPVRGDLFWGFGAAAGETAGRMRHRGGYVLLLPRAANPPDRIEIGS